MIRSHCSVAPGLMMLTLAAGCSAERPGGTDAGVDAAPSDGSVFDRDGSPPMDGGSCGVGVPCDPARGCAEFECQGSLTTQLGSSGDAIIGFPGGVISAGAPLFGAGYCTSAPLNTGANPPRCEVDDPNSCPPCSSCVTLFESAGIPRRACLRSCLPSLSDNPCPSGYACQLGLEVCLDACVSDDQCRVSRRDSDEDGDIESPASNSASSDRLVYDSSAGHRCDPEVGRCRHDGRSTASAGDPCSWDGDCEADGRCQYSPRFHDRGMPSGRGYCTKVGCNLAGNGCANGGKCQRRGVGQTWCLAACEVGMPAGRVGDPDALFQNHRDCRPGHACIWDGTSGVGVARNGGCLPGNFNAIRVPNVGADCATDADCYSPLGLGLCGRTILGDQRDACAVTDCGAPLPSGLPDPCGDGARCIQFLGSGSTVCRQSCSGAAECGAGEACWDPTGMLPIASTGAICLPACFAPSQAAADGQCRSGEVCGAGFVPDVTPGRCQASSL